MMLFIYKSDEAYLCDLHRPPPYFSLCISLVKMPLFVHRRQSLVCVIGQHIIGLLLFFFFLVVFSILLFGLSVILHNTVIPYIPIVFIMVKCIIDILVRVRLHKAFIRV